MYKYKMVQCLKVGIVGTLLVLMHTTSSVLSAECGGSDWRMYNNEKCFKIVDQFVNKTVADLLCKSEIGADTLIPEILTIRHPTEQEFVTKFAYESGNVFDNFWIGASRNEEGEFVWNNDGSLVAYTNWADDYPTEDTQNGCLQLTSKVGQKPKDVADVDGLWKDVPCNKRNLVICQKLSTLTIPEILASLNELKNNPVPLGFIYTQLPNKPNPQTIWPNLVWKNVTSEYAGLFFRAEGGSSGKFGEVQGESTKRLTIIDNHDMASQMVSFGQMSAIPGEWTPMRTTAFWDNSGSVSRTFAIRFYVSNDEVKPRNTAVQIWERIQ